MGSNNKDEHRSSKKYFKSTKQQFHTDRVFSSCSNTINQKSNNLTKEGKHANYRIFQIGATSSHQKKVIPWLIWTRLYSETFNDSKLERTDSHCRVQSGGIAIRQQWFLNYAQCRGSQLLPASNEQHNEHTLLQRFYELLQLRRYIRTRSRPN